MKDRTPIGIAATVGGLVVVYVFSPPFVGWTLIKLGMEDSALPFFRYFYTPVFMLYEHFPPYKMVLDALFKMLIP